MYRMDFCCCCRLLKIANLYFEILIITLCRFNRIDLNCNLWPLNGSLSLVRTTYNNWTIFYRLSIKFASKKIPREMRRKNHYNTSFKDHLIVGEAISCGKYLSNSHLLSFIVMRKRVLSILFTRFSIKHASKATHKEYNANVEWIISNLAMDKYHIKLAVSRQE